MLVGGKGEEFLVAGGRIFVEAVVASHTCTFNVFAELLLCYFNLIEYYDSISQILYQSAIELLSANKD